MRCRCIRLTANPDYYRRHLDVDPADPNYVNMLLQYIIDDDNFLVVNVLAFLHLLLLVQEALLSLFNKLFSCHLVLPSPLELFDRTYGAKIRELAVSTEESRTLLQELGIWDAGAK